jgi:Leucine-rich repeat (LRR) protein
VLQPKAELEELPEELCGLPSLQYLDVSGNKVMNHLTFPIYEQNPRPDLFLKRA